MHLDGYGCAGASAVEYGVANREVEYWDSGPRSFVSVQGSLAMFPIRTDGSEAQRAGVVAAHGTRRRDRVLRADREPGYGSDPSSMTTQGSFATARDWVLTGHKKWNTNKRMSDVAIVWAKDEALRDPGVRGAESAAPGVEFSPLEHAWSLRAAARSELHLRDVRLPAEALSPVIEGLKRPL